MEEDKNGLLSKYWDLVRSTFEFSKFVRFTKGLINKDINKAELETNEARKQVEVFDAILGEIPPEALKPPPRPRYMELTEDDRKLAESILNSNGGSELIASRNNIEISKDKIQCLRDREWLNDEVINFYFDLLNDLPIPKRGRPRTYLWNSFFWLKLSDDGKGYNYKAVQRWTTRKKINLFSYDRFIVPMNIGRNHWALGLVDISNKRIRYYDSLAAGTVHTAFSEYMVRYLEDEFKDKHQGEACPEFSKEFLIEPVDPPQQRNGFDCGVFTCMNAECLASGRDWIDFDQSSISNMRKKILIQIMRGQISS